MKSYPPRAPRAILALALALAGQLAPGTSLSGDLRGAQIEGLRTDLRGVRTRLERTPRASVYDLKQLQRRLSEQRAGNSDDPRLDRLELKRRQAQWRAERILRRDALAAGQVALEAARGRLAAPGYLRAPTDLDIRGTALPIGTGKRFLFVQSGLRAAEEALDRGRTGAAATRLAEAAAGLRALQRDWADDPNLIALNAEIAALAARIAAAGAAG